jgi:hypothetical protein
MREDYFFIVPPLCDTPELLVGCEGTDGVSVISKSANQLCPAYFRRIAWSF